MTVHLIKLSVGPESLADLRRWQQQRLRDKRQKGEAAELMHITRNTPKRAEELLDGGSIYWVIKGILCGRQELRELRPLDIDGVPHCGLVLGDALIPVSPRPHRAFQGWRYLQPQDAPPDLRQGDDTAEMPEEMRQELARLGLI